LGVYPCSPDIYNVVQFFHSFCLSETSSALTPQMYTYLAIYCPW
jgi:hypothetical protein